MIVTGSTIEQLEKGRQRRLCRKWRVWATTEAGRKSKRVNGTYTDALEAQRAFVDELEAQVPNPETFGAYAESWRLWREKSGALSPGTCERDRRDVAALGRTPLGGMRMDEIGPEDCRDAISWLREHPVRGDGVLSNTTLNKIGQSLKMITAQAHEDGRISRDPAAGLKLPKLDTEERDALSPAELSGFLDKLDAMPLDGRVMALYFMACLGLRRGEACGLLVDDVSGGLCHVHQAVKERDNSVASTKTKAGMRVLPVPPRLQAKVDQWAAVRKRMGFDGPFMCCNTHGDQMTIQPFQKWWKRTRAELGYPDMVMHQLRHSNLSMVARHMSLFDLMAYAGWSSIEPAKVYVHRDLDSVTRAVADAWCVIERTKNAPDEEKGQSI